MIAAEELLDEEKARVGRLERALTANGKKEQRLLAGHRETSPSTRRLSAESEDSLRDLHLKVAALTEKN